MPKAAEAPTTAAPRRSHGASAHADLLRALALAGPDAAAASRLAALLGFAPEARPVAPTVDPEPDPAPPPQPLLPDEPSLPPESSPAREPLQARHWAITRCERVAPAEEPETPEPTVAPLTRADCQPRRSGSAPFVPLVRPAALWPALRRSLVCQRPAGPDLPRLGRQLALGRMPSRLPRRQRLAWQAELLVLVDQADALGCYQADFEALLQRLQALRGGGGLQRYAVYAVPGQVLGAPPGRRLELPRPAPGQLVLVLSDMGALSPTSHAHAHWLRWLQQCAHAGAPVVAWVPHARAQLSTALAQAAQVHCLHAASGLRAQRGQIADEAQRQREAARLAALREQLLLLGACCVRMEPALLRALRAASPQTAQEPGLEALAWGHQPVVRASGISRPLAPEHQAAYRQRFAALPVAQQRAAFEAARHIHAWQGRSTQEAEMLLWRTQASAEAQAGFETQSIEAASHWFRRLEQSAQGHGELGAGLRSFAADFLERQAGNARFLPAAAAAHLWACSQMQALPAGIDPAAAAQAREAWARRQGQGGQRLALWQRGRSLLLADADAPPPGPASSRIGMPFQAAAALWAPQGQATCSLSPQQAVPWPQQAAASLFAGGLRFQFEALQRPPWASEFGRDRWGVYADLAVGSEVQRLRWVEPGEFLMGSPADEADRYEDEGPQHRVRITEGFWLADSACTQALWLAVLGGKNPAQFTQANGGGPQHPVEQVSWDDVQRFLRKLGSAVPGASAALPTEAEWEYACRAGTEGPFSFGENITPEQVNYHGEYRYRDGKKGPFRGMTVPVRSLPANPWGLYETHGNVFEWCADGQRDYSDAEVVDPGRDAPGVLARRALRGGSWIYFARRARCAFRNADGPAGRHDFLGFRFALRSQSPASPGQPGALEGRTSAPRDEAPASAGTVGAPRPQAAPEVIEPPAPPQGKIKQGLKRLFNPKPKPEK